MSPYLSAITFVAELRANNHFIFNYLIHIHDGRTSCLHKMQHTNGSNSKKILRKVFGSPSVWRYKNKAI